MTDDLDGVLDALHGDKKAVLKEQLKSIEGEIAERRLIGVDNTLAIHGELGELRNEELNLTREDQSLPDKDRRDRMVVERERLDLSRELREEHRDTWKDVQNLQREERDVEKELSTTEHEHRRTKELL